MCGRVGFFDDKGFVETAKRYFDIQNHVGKLIYSYNTGPTQPIATLLNTKEYCYTHFGLIPHWAKDSTFHPFNARAETLTEKPVFKKPYQNNRCIIPVNGYYEWRLEEDGKHPYWIYPKEGDFFAIAGIYDRWEDRSNGDIITGTAIITTKANRSLERIHDRMPVILKSSEWALWLDEEVHETDALRELLHPIGAKDALFYEVAKEVGNILNNNPELIKALA